MMEALGLVRLVISKYLGMNEDDTYNLEEIDLGAVDPAVYAALLDAHNQLSDLQEHGVDVYDLNWIDMQEQVLHGLVADAVRRFRAFVLLNAPGSTLLMSNREILAAAEATRAIADVLESEAEQA